MRYIPTDKYTVAWFKLAECVAKGEKEKAFGVYRLLMHSLEDKAYAHQLEGDLLGAFQDERALEKYEHAAQLYVANNRWKEAIALYEEIASMTVDNSRAIHCLVQLYTKNKKPEQCAHKIVELAHRLIEKKQRMSLELLVDALPECKLHESTLPLCIAWCFHLIKKNDNTLGLAIEKLVEKTVLYLMHETEKTLLQQFLHQLEQTDAGWNQYAQNYITKIVSK